jgi:hypothetical protein
MKKYLTIDTGVVMIYCNKRKKHIKPEVGQVWLSEFNDNLILLMIGKDDRLLWSKNPSSGVVTTSIDASKHPTIGYLVSELIQEATKPKEQWQPIETAPKNGTDVLVFASGSIYTAYWNMEYNAWMAHNTKNGLPSFISLKYGVTHWMPLPDTPEIEL